MIRISSTTIPDEKVEAQPYLLQSLVPIKGLVDNADNPWSQIVWAEAQLSSSIHYLIEGRILNEYILQKKSNRL